MIAQRPRSGLATSPVIWLFYHAHIIAQRADQQDGIRICECSMFLKDCLSLWQSSAATTGSTRHPDLATLSILGFNYGQLGQAIGLSHPPQKWYLYTTGIWSKPAPILFSTAYDKSTVSRARPFAELVMECIFSLLSTKNIILFVSHDTDLLQVLPAVYVSLPMMLGLVVKRNVLGAKFEQNSGLQGLQDQNWSSTTENAAKSRPRVGVADLLVMESDSQQADAAVSNLDLGIQSPRTQNNVLLGPFGSVASQRSSDVSVASYEMDWTEWDSMILDLQKPKLSLGSQIAESGARISQKPYADKPMARLDTTDCNSGGFLGPKDYNFVMMVHIAIRLEKRTLTPMEEFLILDAKNGAVRAMRQVIAAMSTIRDHTIITAVLLAVIEQHWGDAEKAEAFWSGVRTLMHYCPDSLRLKELIQFWRYLEQTYQPIFLNSALRVQVAVFVTSALKSALGQHSKEANAEVSTSLVPAPSPAATVDSPWSETDVLPPPYMLSPTPLKQACLIYASVNAKR